MPLNPNGKIDKPKLPFPDTAQAGARDTRPKAANKLTPTQQTLLEIWSLLLTNPPSPIPVDESFFDIGGHSILATRLIFEIRKTFAIEAPLNLIFQYPTISNLASAIENLKNDDLDLTTSAAPAVPESIKNENDYVADYEALAASKLKASYQPAILPADGVKLTVFLTGGTGFLGSFILAQLLNSDNVKQVICLVRGKGDEDALNRLRSAAEDRGVWQDIWIQDGRISVITGDLSEPMFGIRQNLWDSLCESVDAVVHNGALVRSFTFCGFSN